ncbi:TPA: hypothetical protein I7676_01690 [Vibrio vulnificus]|nr:hypothetical protein [Vibrio vulnificus]HAS8217082.1 hypothetical protein [Vibrio vulnificus]HAS8296065.1 hypothetical protein [Vibrio vulnificus]
MIPATHFKNLIDVTPIKIVNSVTLIKILEIRNKYQISGENNLLERLASLKHWRATLADSPRPQKADSSVEFTPVIQDGGLLTLRVLSLRPCARSLNPNVDRDTGKR